MLYDMIARKRKSLPDVVDYEIAFKKRNALFWIIVNITCVLTIPAILSCCSFVGQSTKVIVSMYFIFNICVHLFTIFRKPKDKDKAINLGRTPLKPEYSSNSCYNNENGINLIPQNIGMVHTYNFEDVEGDNISNLYKYELGILITRRKEAIRSCSCPILNHKCRLCPFRVFSLEDFKSWFLYASAIHYDKCKSCGSSIVVDQIEYERLLSMRYPYHYCKCDCQYCSFAMKHPLKPRVNLIPDSMHCTCVCRQCRDIEDIIHGLQPLLEASLFRFAQDMHPTNINFESNNRSSFPQQLFDQVRGHTPPNPAGTAHYTTGGLGNNRYFQFQNELWSAFKINPYNLVTWIANLRAWISNTIVKRIVDEITLIDEGLHLNGLPLVSVGSVGCDMLNALAQTPEVAGVVPTLVQILPFLSVSEDHGYVVQRIRELAVGNIMSGFAGPASIRANKGQTAWNRQPLSDSELVMHLVVTYLDLMLPVILHDPAKRTFSSRYFAKYPGTPQQKGITIYLDSESPPHYQLIINEVTIQIPPGFNNVFIAIILFIHSVRVLNDGVLERVNLGPAGLNMLWIVDDSNII